MNKISRRALAKYAADQLLAGKPAKQVAQHLAAAMIESGNAQSIDFLLGDISAELENRRELAFTKVVSATPLSDELRTHLKNQIKKATKAREAMLEESVDSSVIGGARIETASRVWDNTIARKLADLREAF